MKLVTSLECLLFYTTFSGRQPWAYCSKHLRIISRSDHSSKATQDIKANGREKLYKVENHNIGSMRDLRNGHLISYSGLVTGDSSHGPQVQ